MQIHKDKLKKYTDELRNYECPLCHASDWILDDHVFCLEEYLDDSELPKKIFQRMTYPVIVATCPCCGLSLFINAVAAGVVMPDHGQNME